MSLMSPLCLFCKESSRWLDQNRCLWLCLGASVKFETAVSHRPLFRYPASPPPEKIICIFLWSRRLSGSTSLRTLTIKMFFRPLVVAAPCPRWCPSLRTSTLTLPPFCCPSLQSLVWSGSQSRPCSSFTAQLRCLSALCYPWGGYLHHPCLSRLLSSVPWCLSVSELVTSLNLR